MKERSPRFSRFGICQNEIQPGLPASKAISGHIHQDKVLADLEEVEGTGVALKKKANE